MTGMKLSDEAAFSLGEAAVRLGRPPIAAEDVLLEAMLRREMTDDQRIAQLQAWYEGYYYALAQEKNSGT